MLVIRENLMLIYGSGVPKPHGMLLFSMQEIAPENMGMSTI
jgi:hypothetical protein